MNKNGHNGLTTKACGFIIHPTKGWLGASPNAKVNDPSRELFGVAEFKYPYSKRDVSPLEACCDPNFFVNWLTATFSSSGHTNIFIRPRFNYSCM